MSDSQIEIPVTYLIGKRLTMRQQDFLESETGVEARQRLELMVGDLKFNTSAGITGNTESLTFVDKHMLYLCEHPKLSTEHYLANLRLKTRVR